MLRKEVLFLASLALILLAFSVSFSFVLAQNETDASNTDTETSIGSDSQIDDSDVNDVEDIEQEDGRDEELESETEENDSEETQDDLSGVEDLKYGSGITPDNFFYFIEDNILTIFRDELANREKKIAEIREMIRQGNIDAARIALDRYSEYADELEKKINP